MKRIMIMTRLATIISLLMPIQIFSQDKDLLSFNQMMIDKYSNNVIKDSSIMKIELLTNNIDSVCLKIINFSSDTIYMPRKIVLESPKPISYILFCISDSTLNIESSDGFNNNIPFNYSFNYCHVDELSGIVDYKQVKITSNHTNKYGMVFIPPFSSESLPLDCYFRKKYMYIRFQTLINKKGFVFKLQKETNSIYMP